MGLITWSDGLSVHIDEIDCQHKQLVKYINDLNDALLAGDGQDAVGSILDALFYYTVTHFGTEEKYFAKFAYAESAAHKQEHEDFVKLLMEHKREFEGGSKSVPWEVLNLLYGWLLEHIKSRDKKYTACFLKNGLT